MSTQNRLHPHELEIGGIVGDDGPPAGPRSVIGWRTLVFVVALVVVEVALRQAGFGQWTATEQSERYGWVMLPDQDAWSRDLSVPEHVNSVDAPLVADGSCGFRDRQWTAELGRPRIAVLGQSMTFGTSVPLEQCWVRVLEDELDGAVVMNFAVQGYVFEQMARVYDDLVRPWKPDLVVVPLHPHDVLKMKPGQDDAAYDFRRLVLRTATFDLLNRHVINRWMPPPPARDRQALVEYEKLDLSVTEKPFAKEHAPLWDALMLRLDGLRRDVVADGGRLVVVTLPRWRKLFDPKLLGADGRLSALARAHADEVLHVDPMPDFVEPMAPMLAEIERVGLTDDVPYTSDLSTLSFTDEGVVRPATELATSATSLFLPNDLGHFTAAGHRLIGEDIARALAEAGWLR